MLLILSSMSFMPSSISVPSVDSASVPPFVPVPIPSVDSAFKLSVELSGDPEPSLFAAPPLSGMVSLDSELF
jgi:hypothetical protein